MDVTGLGLRSIIRRFAVSGTSREGRGYPRLRSSGRPRGRRGQFRRAPAAFALAALAFALAGAAALPGQADAATLVSNSGQTATTNLNVRHDNNYRTAQQFTTGSNEDGYTLTAVKLYLAFPSGTGATVRILNDNSGLPGTTRYTLTTPSTLSTALGEVTFTAPSSATLVKETKYWVELQATGGDISLGRTEETDEDSGNESDWSIRDLRHYTNAQGDYSSSQGSFRMMRLTVEGTVDGGTNTAPTASNSSVSMPQDTDFTFDEDEFLFADADAGDTLASVKITSLPDSGKGSLKLDGAAIASGDLPQTVTKAQLDDDKLVYSPPAGESGEDFATFEFKVNDGQADSAAEYTMTISVLSTDATLSALAVAEGTNTLSFDHPTFDSTKTTYYLSVGNGVTMLKVTPTTSNEVTKIEYLDASNTAIADQVSSTVETLDASLAVGANVIKVKVTAQTATSTKTYTIHVARAAAAPTDTCDAIWCANLTVGRDSDPDASTRSHGYSRVVTTLGFAGGLEPNSIDGHLVNHFEYTGDGLTVGLATQFPSGNYLLQIDGENLPLSRIGGGTSLVSKDEDIAAVRRINRTFGAVLPVKLRALTAPGAPTGLSATANGATQIDLTWTAPADNGGSAITGYKIEWSADGSTNWAELVASHDGTTYSNTGLTAGTTRYYRVSAINSVGTGDASGTANATTSGTDTAGPTFTSAEVPAAGTHIYLTMSEDIDTTNLPPASAFSVATDGAGANVEAVSARPGVTDGVSLELDRTIFRGESIQISYTDPSANNDTAALQDASGNDAASFALQTVTNNSTQLGDITVDFAESSYAFAEETASHTVTLVAKTADNAAPAFRFAVTVNTDTSVVPAGEAGATDDTDFVRIVSQSVIFETADFAQEGGVYVARKSFTVTMRDDTDVEPTEYFGLVLDRSPGLLAVVKLFCNANSCSVQASIVDDDATTPPEQVTGLELTSGRDYIGASWDPALRAANYRVEWKSGSQGYAASRSKTVTDTATSITDLAEETEYTVRVTAVNDFSAGPPSAERRLSTGLPDDQPLVSIEAVSSTVTEGGSAKFTVKLLNRWPRPVTVRVLSRGAGFGHGGLGGRGGVTRVFPPNRTGEEEIEIRTVDDDWPGGGGELVAWIEPGGGLYRVTPEARVTVVDDDAGVRKAPSAPRELDAVAGNARVTLEWRAPASDGGRAVYDYEYRVTHSSGSSRIAGTTDGWVSTRSTATSLVLTGLTNDALPQMSYYTFEVRAVNASGEAGRSAASNRASAIPTAVASRASPPGRPRNVTATPDASGGVVLSWNAPLADGGSPVTDYQYIAQEHASSPRSWSTTNGARWVSAGTATSVTVTTRGNGEALESGRPYVFMVRALNTPRRGFPGYGDPSAQVWATPAGGAVQADDGDDMDASLAMIDVSRCASLGFFPWRTEYVARVDADAPNLQIKVRPRDARATVAFRDTRGNTLSDSHDDIHILRRALTDDEVVVVRVTAADGVTVREYRVTVSTASGGDTSMMSRFISGGELEVNVEYVDSQPYTHNGEDAFEVYLAFTDPLHDEFSYRTLKDHAITVEGGTIQKVGRVNRTGADRNRRWKVTVQPSGSDVVVLRLEPGGPACGTEHALCTEDGRQLKAGAFVLVLGPQEESDDPVDPLTAAWTQAPGAGHDGATAFEVRIAFSEAIWNSWTHVKQAVTATGGTVNWSKRVEGKSDLWRLRVTPSGNEAVDLTLNGGGTCGATAKSSVICTGAGGRVLSNSPEVTVQGPVAISVADASATEGTDDAVVFTVSLSRPAPVALSVNYATADGTAGSPGDYTETTGTLNFAQGDQTKTISVPIVNDSHDDGGETFTLTLSAASSGYIADGEATGTIENADAMPSAWTARFGRTVAEQVLEAVESRMQAPRTPGAEVSVAGERIGLGPVFGAESPDGGDAAALAERRREAEAEREAKRLAEWLRGETDPERRREDGGRTVAPRELLLGSSFSLAAGEARTGHYALWGRGSVSRFDGREGALSVDGEVASALLGADWSRERVAAGLIVGHSLGDGTYRGESDGGAVESTLTGVYPWGRYALSERVSAWGAAGYGEGTLTLTPEGQAPMRTDLDLLLGAAGLRGVVVQAPETGGPELAVKTDAMGVRTTTARVTGLAASEAEVTRLRLGLEGSWAVRFEGGATLTPSLEIGVRHDGGDAETGTGADLGAGVAWSDPGGGLSAELRGRGLLSHEAAGFRERGLSGALSFDPTPGSDRGVSLTLRQTVGGSATGGMDALLGRRTLAGLAADDGGDELADRRFELRLGYGLAAFGDRFTSTPEAGLALSNAAREYSLGWRLSLVPGPAAGALEFGLEATRREAANDNAPGAGPVHAAGVRVTARW